MLALLILLASFATVPDTGPVTWRFQAQRTADGSVRVELTTEVEAGWHIYATSLPSDQGPIATSIRFTPSDAFVLVGSLEEPAPKEVFDENFGMDVRYHEGSPAFAQVVRPVAPGAFDIEGEVEYMVCNDKTCLPPVVVPFKLRVETK